MSSNSTKRSDKICVITVVGPTACGKSALAVDLAREFNGEIISADSRQVYKSLDIGSGKITKKEMRGVPHHLLDVASPRRVFSVARYQKLGTRAIRQIHEKGKIPIICGGTGFYVDALIYDAKLPEVPPDKKLRNKLAGYPAAKLFARLEKLDPARAASIDRHNPVRLIRALEIVLTTGKAVPALGSEASPYQILKLGIETDREKLNAKIRDRLRSRLKHGMIAEVARLHSAGVSWRRLEELGLEYRFIARHLRGELTRDQMTEQLEQAIKDYAKRQMTWFRKDPDTVWIAEHKKASAEVRRFLKK